MSGGAITCCLVITIGYFAGIDQEGLSGWWIIIYIKQLCTFCANLKLWVCTPGGITIKGIIFGVLSSCCVSLNSIYTKKVLPAVDDSVWTLNYYNNLNASLLFIPLMFIFGELPHTVFVTQMTELDFWLLMSLGGVMGVLIGFVTGLQIKVRHCIYGSISYLQF